MTYERPGTRPKKGPTAHGDMSAPWELVYLPELSRMHKTGPEQAEPWPRHSPIPWQTDVMNQPTSDGLQPSSVLVPSSAARSAPRSVLGPTCNDLHHTIFSSLKQQTCSAGPGLLRCLQCLLRLALPRVAQREARVKALRTTPPRFMEHIFSCAMASNLLDGRERRKGY